jgi:hypothetical protein
MACERDIVADHLHREAPVLDLLRGAAEIDIGLVRGDEYRRESEQQEQPDRHRDHHFDQRHAGLQAPRVVRGRGQ